ncbi:MAG: hypothetical protein ACRDIV_17855 [Ktedonobacteraceae bacterium]
MKIALLAWGSLMWDPGNLAVATDWEQDGPELPLELSRVSECRCNALTLVIDPKNGKENRTYFAVSPHRDLDDAIHTLRQRECPTSECIGSVNCTTGKYCSRIPHRADTIYSWAEKNDCDAAIWTDLSSHFRQKTTMEFTVDTAWRYLHGLETAGTAKAREYIEKAPARIETPLLGFAHGWNTKLE